MSHKVDLEVKILSRAAFVDDVYYASSFQEIFPLAAVAPNAIDLPPFFYVASV